MPLQTTKYVDPAANYCNLSTTSIITSGYSIRQADGFPLTNLLSSDRYAVYKCPAMAANEFADIVFDFGAMNKTLGALGILGFSLVGTSPSLICECRHATVLGTWTDFSPILMPLPTTGRNSIQSPTAVFNKRYLRLTFNAMASASGGFTLGKVLAASTITDLSIVYAPGSTESHIMQNSRVRLLDGHEVVTSYGPNRRAWVMEFPAVSHLTRSRLVSLAHSTTPFVLQAPSGEAFECRAIADTFTSQAVWGVVGTTASDLWNCAFEVESLP